MTAAQRVFASDGFGGASIDKIAAEAGVSKQTVYNHFGDKRRLFLAMIDEARARVAAREDFGRRGKQDRQQHGQDRKRNRTVEMRDAGVKRDQQGERREDAGRRPDHRNERVVAAALGEKAGSAEG